VVPSDVETGTGDFREVVLRGIHGCASGGGYLRGVLRREFTGRDFPVRLRRAATQLASGIIRRRLTLDHLIAQFSDLPLAKIDPLLLDVLRLGAYEVLFVERVPAHAAVSEAVNLAKRLVRPAFSGFTNAVLRNLVRAIEKAGCATAGLSSRELSPRVLPAAPGRAVRFNRDVFPDPSTDPVGWLAAAGGMPGWLVERWRRNFTPDEVFRIVEASNAQPPVSIRVNTLRTTDAELVATLAAEGVETTPTDIHHSLVVTSPVELSALEAFKAGMFYIQDTSAMLAPQMLAPCEGEKVLDLCAAPGGKTTHLAELSGDRADVYALDVSRARLALVEENAGRLGITSIRTAVGDATRIDDRMKQAFDAALADVPCSNTGVLRRRVEARHRLRPQTIDRMAHLQTRILRTALAAVRPGGRVVYSTCSIEPEENRDVILQTLKNYPHCKLQTEEVRLPSTDGPDGGYVARLVCR